MELILRHKNDIINYLHYKYNQITDLLKSDSIIVPGNQSSTQRVRLVALNSQRLSSDHLHYLQESNIKVAKISIRTHPRV